MFTFKPSVLEGVAKLTSKDRCRGSLMAVRVEETRRGAKFTASDGKSLIRVACANAAPVADLPEAVAEALAGKNGEKKALVTREGVKSLRAVKTGKARGILALECAAMALSGEVTVSGCVGGDPGRVATVSVETMQGSFPDVEGVIPKRRAKSVKFDAVVLRDALDAMISALGTDKDGKALVRLKLRGDKFAAVLTGSNKAEKRAAIVLAMPHS